MKRVVFLLVIWLAVLPACGQNIRVQGNPFEGRHVVRHGQLYVLLQPFSQALKMPVRAAGEGYRGGSPEGEAPQEVPKGFIQVGDQRIELWLDSGDVYVPAEAYCKALGLSVRRDAGGGLRVGPPAPAHTVRPKSVPNDPESYFVTQYRSRYNQWAPKVSSNCGPACMSMVALAYGVAPEGLLPGDRQGLIQWCRQSMTQSDRDQSRGTKCDEIERMATLLGLKSRWIRRFQDLDSALAAGQLVVVGGDITRLGAPGGNHFLLCVGQRGNDYIINDPGGFFPTPGTRLPADTMEQFFIEAVALYP